MARASWSWTRAYQSWPMAKRCSNASPPTWPDVQIVIMGWGEAGDSRIARTATAFVPKSVPPEEFVAATLAACGY